MMAGLSCEGLVETGAAWMPHGACRGTDVDEFFVAIGESPKHALAFCARCDVRRECLNYAVTNGISHGIWGGTTPRQRRALTTPQPRGPVYLSAAARERMVWLAKTGWKHHEIAREFDVTIRTVERVFARERAS